MSLLIFRQTGLPDICVGQQKGTDGSIWTPTGQPTEQDLSFHPIDVSPESLRKKELLGREALLPRRSSPRQHISLLLFPGDGWSPQLALLLTSP